jgi:hypothetical protein
VPRRALVAAAAAAAVAGCGGEEPQLPVSSPVPSPTPPPTAELKYDMLVAEQELETHRFAEGAYTDDELQLGPAYPLTVDVTSAGSDGFRLQATDELGITYVLIRRGDRVRRTCKPADPEHCPGGEW